MGNTKKRTHTEYDFVATFVKLYQLKKTQEENNDTMLYAIQGNGYNQSKYADCEIVLNDEIVKIEAKMLNDTNANSTDFYNLIGEIIGTLKKPSLIQEKEGRQKRTSVGFLIPFESENVFASLWRKNINPNGVKYCDAFSVKHLISFDKTNKVIRFFSLDREKDEWK